MTHYKLTYFPVRARAEPIRVILSLAEADWEDNRDTNDSDLEALNKRKYLILRKAIVNFTQQLSTILIDLLRGGV